MADDLRRFLDGEPIAARPVRTWEKAYKWAKRRPAQAGLIGVIAVGLLGLGVGLVAFAGYQSEKARTEAGLRTDAEIARDHAKGQEKLAKTQEQLAVANAERAERNFHDARAAVRDLLTRVGAERLSY